MRVELTIIETLCNYLICITNHCCGRKDPHRTVQSLCTKEAVIRYQSRKEAHVPEKKKNAVIVRGMTHEWFIDHFKDMVVYFGGDPRAVPAYDADYVGFYLEAPDSAITHIGLVQSIDRTSEGATFHLKAVIALDHPVAVEDHAIRKQEYWTLKDLGIDQIALIFNDYIVTTQAT